MNIQRANVLYIWLRGCVTLTVVVGISSILVFLSSNEVPGFMALYAASFVLIFSVNWSLGESRVGWIWLALAIAVPGIGLLAAYRVIQLAVIDAKQRAGHTV